MFAKRLTVMAITAALAALFSGCTVIREYTPEKAEVAAKLPEPEYELARKLLQAFVKNDAEAFVALLPEETRKNFDVKKFRDTRKSIIDSIGEPISYSYMTTLELNVLHPQIWKVRFRRQNVNKTKEFTSEVLFKVVTGTIDKKEAVVTGFHWL